MFDVFLAHNSKDKPQVIAIANELKRRGLNPWLDDEQMCGGDTPLEEIQIGIAQSKSVAFFIGSNGTGKWQGNLELPMTVDLVVNSGLRLIPVLLPGIQEMPSTPNYLFLKTKIWIAIESIEDADIFNKVLNNLEKSIKKPARTTTIQSKKSNKIELKSEKSIDYSKLHDLLVSKKWREADQETADRMLEIIGRNSWQSTEKEDINNLPCTDLKTINELWLNHSQGKFGFSIQKNIYEDLSKMKQCDQDIWEKFITSVGWRRADDWLYCNSIDLNIVPSGHLPSYFFPLPHRFIFFHHLQSLSEV